jgi:CRP-like cAMP-binding protein
MYPHEVSPVAQRFESSVTAVSWIGPGAVVGERAALVNGTRTATLWARTPGRVASVPHDALDSQALGSLAATHRREA